MVLEKKLNINMQKNEHIVDHIDHTTYKNDHVMNKRFNVKSESIRLLEENSRKA